ncbi:uncharacterized protein KY384_008069 [Bacidia gigantensis]|uniref:uncharacterized protein n=1 Tax=Bacidia gigantensis TaxID=2732470 RepID=UPI001D05BA64|nr:uncharacterized protein KY384_008069 [Bacidia gigantensis]KAG8526640.1 hypothetical protein KY384_008069 [Bacidia gigantensis]
MSQDEGKSFARLDLQPQQFVCRDKHQQPGDGLLNNSRRFPITDTKQAIDIVLSPETEPETTRELKQRGASTPGIIPSIVDRDTQAATNLTAPIPVPRTFLTVEITFGPSTHPADPTDIERLLTIFEHKIESQGTRDLMRLEESSFYKNLIVFLNPSPDSFIRYSEAAAVIHEIGWQALDNDYSSTFHFVARRSNGQIAAVGALTLKTEDPIIVNRDTIPETTLTAPIPVPHANNLTVEVYCGVYPEVTADVLELLRQFNFALQAHNPREILTSPESLEIGDMEVNLYSNMPGQRMTYSEAALCMEEVREDAIRHNITTSFEIIICTTDGRLLAGGALSSQPLARPSVVNRDTTILEKREKRVSQYQEPDLV